MKLSYILLTSTAVTLASLAYGKTINTATIDKVVITKDSSVEITDKGSIVITSHSPSINKGNAITIISDVSNATIINNGNIETNISKDGIIGILYYEHIANAIKDYPSVTSVINNGTIRANLKLIGGTTSSEADPNTSINIYSSTNGFTGYNIYINNGVIQTNLNSTGGSTTITEGGGGYVPATASNSANGVYGNIDINSGVIQTNLNLTGGSAIITKDEDIYTEASVSIGNTANGIYGNMDTNNGVIQTNLNLTGGSAIITEGEDIDTEAYVDAANSENGIYGNMDTNNGVIQTNLNSTGGSATITGDTKEGNVHADASAQSAANGIYGNMDTNNGVIQTNLNLMGGSATITGDTKEGNVYAAATDLNAANGIYGNIDINNGTIAAYAKLIGGTENGAAAVTSNRYSSSGAVLTKIDGNVINKGTIIASNKAIDATNKATANNYGTLVGTSIYGSSVTAINNGTEILIDENGTVLSITQGASGTVDGQTTQQAAMVGTTDSYNEYTTETEISNTLLNGAGVSSGLATIKGNNDFTITNSSFNAYSTALELKTTHRVEAINSYFNGGGLLGNKNISYNANDIPVIKGDSQDNFLIVHGTSFINGDIVLGDGADIIVLDTKNVQLNGTADLGSSDDDTFALYAFTGTDAQLIKTSEDYASWGLFNEYLGEKIISFENIGVELGVLSIKDDLITYGLYVGKQAKANFIDNNQYILKNLHNDGSVNLFNNVANNHIHISDYLKGTGTYIFDADFASLKSDYITVNGDITANATIAINDVTSASNKQTATTTEVLLIEAPDDADKSDEDFNLAKVNRYNNNSKQGRFSGSPYIWKLASSGNNWVLTTQIEDSSTPEPPVIPPITPSIVAEIPAYTSLPTIGREIVIDELDTLHNRLGELRSHLGWVGEGPSNIITNLGAQWHNLIGFDDSKLNVWTKGAINHFDMSSTNSFDVKGVYGGFNLGIDKKFELGHYFPSWSVYTGLFGGYKTGLFETSGKGSKHTSHEHADIDINAWSVGGYATFFNTAGTYIDLVGEYMNLNADIDAAGLNSDINGYVFAGSAEIGHSFDLAKNWIIEPQSQLKVAHINWHDFNDHINDINFEDHTYITGRIGVRVEKTIKTSIGEIKPWGYVGVVHEFSDAPKVTYADTVFEAIEYHTAGEIKAGITADIYQSVQMYGYVGYVGDFKDYSSIKGNFGIRINW
ncbi:MAG: autotransporter outer membrane beta-barrel domain-containing protein [Alphaproteobacteria bacterium]